MHPEEKARIEIDNKLLFAGWNVVDRANFSPAMSAVAVTEGILKGHLEADYLLFIEGKAIGVIEAKKEGVPLTDAVAKQAEKYACKLLKWYQHWQNPLPFIYLSNGKELLFKDMRNGEREYKSLQQMHKPKELAMLAGIENLFAGLPYLSPKGLRTKTCADGIGNGCRKDFYRVYVCLSTVELYANQTSVVFSG